MKKNNSYRYPKTQREKIEGKRHYVFDKEKLPSVTTILDATQSAEKREALANWRAPKRRGSWMNQAQEAQLCTRFLRCISWNKVILMKLT